MSASRAPLRGMGIVDAMTVLPRYLLDLVERVAWTAVQAGLGLVTVESLHVPQGYAVLVAAVLALVKGWVARRVGNPGSASTTRSV